MNEKDKIDIKKFINNRAKTVNDTKDALMYLIQEYSDIIDEGMVTLSMMIVARNFNNLKKDFLLLRKNASENLTLNKIYTQNKLNKSRSSGVGYYESKTTKNIIIAAGRFGKDKFPEYMPQTEEILKNQKINKEDIQKAKEEAETLLKLERGDKYY